MTAHLHPHPHVPLDLGPRGTGKTTRAKAWLTANPERRCLVVPTSDIREHLQAVLRTEHPDIRWQGNHVLTGAQARAALAGRRDVEVYVDQADEVLRRLLQGARLLGASWTEPGSLLREPAVEAP